VAPATIPGYATLPLWAIAMYLPITATTTAVSFYSPSLPQAWPGILIPALFADFVRLWFAWRDGALTRPARRVRVVVARKGVPAVKAIPSRPRRVSRDPRRGVRLLLWILATVFAVTGLSVYVPIIVTEARRGAPSYVVAWADRLGLGAAINPAAWQERIGAPGNSGDGAVAAAIYHTSDVCVLAMLIGWALCLRAIRRIDPEEAMVGFRAGLTPARLAHPRTLLLGRGVVLIALVLVAAWPLSIVMEIVWACEGCDPRGAKGRSPAALMTKLAWLASIMVALFWLLGAVSARLLSLWIAWLDGARLEVVRD